MNSTTGLNRRDLLGLGSAGLLATAASANPIDGRTQAQLLHKPYRSSATGKDRQYLLYLPTGFYSEPNKKWPVILFLHGGGERGNGADELDHVLRHGPLMEAWIQGRDLPFVMIAPQMPMFDRERRSPLGETPKRVESGAPPERDRPGPPRSPMDRSISEDEPRWDEKGPPDGWWRVEDDLIAMVDEVLADYQGDPARVYLTGLSYGGFGTWHMASAHPDRWAAIAPICGGGNPEQARIIAKKQTPVWIFQGGRDTTVKPKYVLRMAQELEKDGHPEVRLTVHEDLPHNVWTRVYEGRDIYDWLLKHRLEK